MAVMLIADMFNDWCYSKGDESDVLLVYLMTMVLLFVCFFLFGHQESFCGNFHNICMEKSSLGLACWQVLMGGYTWIAAAVIYSIYKNFNSHELWIQFIPFHACLLTCGASIKIALQSVCTNYDNLNVGKLIFNECDIGELYKKLSSHQHHYVW
jgi:hypothetical protein